MARVVKTKSSTRVIGNRVKAHHTVRSEFEGRFRVYQRDQFGARSNASTVVDLRAALARVRELVMNEVQAVMYGKSERDRERGNAMYQYALDAMELHFDYRRSPIYFVVSSASGTASFLIEEIT